MACDYGPVASPHARIRLPVLLVLLLAAFGAFEWTPPMTSSNDALNEITSTHDTSMTSEEEISDPQETPLVMLISESLEDSHESKRQQHQQQQQQQHQTLETSQAHTWVTTPEIAMTPSLQTILITSPLTAFVGDGTQIDGVTLESDPSEKVPQRLTTVTSSPSRESDEFLVENEVTTSLTPSRILLPWELPVTARLAQGSVINEERVTSESSTILSTPSEVRTRPSIEEEEEIISQVKEIEIENPTWMNLPTPPCFIRTLSCFGRCSVSADETVSRHDVLGQGQAICQCDMACMYMGDCCRDFLEVCLNVADGRQTEDYLTNNGSLLLPPMVPTRRRLEEANLMYKIVGTCESLRVLDTGGNTFVKTFWTVGRCLEGYVDGSIKGIREKCEGNDIDRLFSFPVSHRWNRRLTFRNVYCAMCHGVDMRDIVFWRVDMHCSLQHTFNIRSYYDMRNVLSQNTACLSSLVPVLPEAVELRPCRYMTDHERCTLPTNDQPAPLEQSDLLMTLCNLYLYPVRVNGTGYANVHCASCSGQTLHDASQCNMIGHIRGVPFQHMMASLSFWNGRLEISSQVTEQFMTFTDNGPVFASSSVWMTHRNLRHNRCWSASEDPRIQFFDACDMYLCPDEAIPPSKDLPGVIRLCSVRRYRFDGDYGSIFSSPKNGSAVNLEFRLSNQDFTLTFLIDKMFAVINDVINVHVGRFLSHQFQVRSAIKLPGDEALLSLSWTSSEHCLTVLQLLDLIHHRLQLKLSSLASKTVRVTSTVSNVREAEDVCPSGEAIAFHRVDLVPFGYDALFVLENMTCYLDLERVGFRTTFTTAPGKGIPPATIDQVLLCNDSRIEDICGKFPNAPVQEDMLHASGGEVELVDLVDLDLSPSTDGAMDDFSVLDDSKIFNRACYGLCAFNELLIVIWSLVMMTRKSKSFSNDSGYLIHLVIGVSFLFMMILYLLAPDIDHRGDIPMGALSHLCWLCLASMTVVNLLYCLSENRSQLPVDTNAANFIKVKVKAVLKIVILIVVGIVAICVVFDSENLHGVEIGYSHKSGRLLWLSSQTSCLVGFVMPYSIFLLIVCVLRTATCVHLKKTSGEDPRMSLFSKAMVAVKSGFLFEVLSTLLIVVVLLNYFDDDRHSLWSFFFSLTSSLFGVWHAAVFWGQGHNSSKNGHRV